LLIPPNARCLRVPNPVLAPAEILNPYGAKRLRFTGTDSGSAHSGLSPPSWVSGIGLGFHYLVAHHVARRQDYFFCPARNSEWSVCTLDKQDFCYYGRRMRNTSKTRACPLLLLYPPSRVHTISISY